MPCNLGDVRDRIRKKKYLHVDHSTFRKGQRRIEDVQLIEAIGFDNPRIIDNKVHGCLVLGWLNNGKPLHSYVAVSTTGKIYGRLKIVTLYRPHPWLWKNNYELGVYMLPKELDEEVARLHLAKLGVKLTTLSEEQADYIGVKVKGPYKASHYRY